MFVLDLIVTGFIGYLLVSRLQIIPYIVERGALAILIGAGVKSLTLFAFILFGFQPVLALQLPVSLGILFVTFFLFKPAIGTTHPGPVCSLPDGFSWAKIISPVVLFVLLLLSLKMALNVPITEADGIWYHIKGMAYFHSADLNSEAVTLQMRQYPPFVSLIFCYMLSGEIETVKVLFPILFLSLLVVFYYRTTAHTRDGELAAIFTLVLGTTPYLWWHSSLPFLDLTVGTFYGLGTIYAFFIASELKKPASLKQAQSWALLSGSLFGLAGWTRWEYLIYDLAPVVLLFIILNRMSSMPHLDKKKIISCFCLPLLALPTLWCLTVLLSGSPSYSKTPEVMFICAGLWAFFLWMTFSKKAEARIEPKKLVFPILYGALIFMAFALLRGIDGLFYNGSVALFRLIAGPLFFAFTPVLALLIFIKKQSLSGEAKFLAALLLGFVILHLGVFTYADLKWGEWQEYVRATFFKPGSSINLSDVRGMIAFYPAFVFFIAILPSVAQSFSDRRKVSCP